MLLRAQLASHREDSQRLHRTTGAHFIVALGCRLWLAMSIIGRVTCCEASPNTKERLRRTEAAQSKSALVTPRLCRSLCSTCRKGSCLVSLYWLA